MSEEHLKIEVPATDKHRAAAVDASVSIGSSEIGLVLTHPPVQAHCAYT
jgi:hypothetical protein